MIQLEDPSLLRTHAYLGGQWVDAAGGATLPVVDPATGQQVATVPAMGEGEAQRALGAADAAWPAWRARTAKDRAAVLRRWFELMLAHRNDLALIMTREQGKPLAEARAEIDYAASFVEWFAEEGKRVCGETLPVIQHGKRMLVLKQPVGVCAAITPWNFPAAMITRKAGAALAAGCTMVVKPAEQTPLSALALAALAERAGLPGGVFNVITGDPVAIGQVLTRSPVVRKVTFTGSTEVGRLLMRQSADTVKKISLELGGNAPFVVFEDADLDAAVEGAMASKFRNAGQTCVCANRILVQRGVHDAFAAKIAAKVAKLKVGAGTETGVEQGPLIDMAALEKVKAHVADAVEKGAQVLIGGRRHALGGTFFEPTVMTGITRDMRVMREETFGPVAPLLRFESEAEAIQLANDTESGLAAYFYSRDVGRVFRVAEALDFGMIGVNTGAISNEVAPFGGMKQSGIGREGSSYGIEEYLEIKYVCIGGISDYHVPG
jgi:succinate-semialdehyde dehydrogenase/glutarate-semialdehyde dehydrogenase